MQSKVVFRANIQKQRPIRCIKKQRQMKYFFDKVDGPAKETSHPNFVKTVDYEFYYDATDEISPFGNEFGAETLKNLENRYRDPKIGKNIVQWMFLQIDEIGFDFQSKACSEIFDLETLKKIHEQDDELISAMDNSIIATGFGQIKITGKIDPKLKDLTIKALDREQLMNNDHDYLNRLQKMKSDLLNFK